MKTALKGFDVEKIPGEWVDKLFTCLQMFYGERFEKLYPTKKHDLYKTIWRSALFGLSYEQIKNTLQILKRASQHPAAEPPTHLEFWRYASGKSDVHIDYTDVKKSRSNPEIAREAMAAIKKNLCSVSRRT